LSQPSRIGHGIARAYHQPRGMLRGKYLSSAKVNEYEILLKFFFGHKSNFHINLIQLD